MLTFRILSGVLLAGLSISGFCADIIIESRPTGQNYSSYKEVKGNWLDSNTPPDTAKSDAPGLTPQGELGSRKSTIANLPGTPADSILSAARFTPNIETAGDYHVYITFPKAANASPVTIFIKSAKGEETKEITQNGWGISGAPNGNTWVELGTFPFSPGGDQYVEMRVTGASVAVDRRNAAQAYADAMRFSTEPVSNSKRASPPITPPAAVTTPEAPVSNADLEWSSDLATARAEASKANKKVFVFFYSPQSSRSTDYEKNVINDPKVKGAIIAGYIPLKIDMDAERQLSSQLQVFRAGTVNIYDAATGSGLEHISDTPDVNELIKRLNAVD